MSELNVETGLTGKVLQFERMDAVKGALLDTHIQQRPETSPDRYRDAWPHTLGFLRGVGGFISATKRASQRRELTQDFAISYKNLQLGTRLLSRSTGESPRTYKQSAALVDHVNDDNNYGNYRHVR
jgi:hypothetical protein